MDLGLSGRVAVIAGAGGRCGSGFARDFARAGASVGLLGRNIEALRDLSEQLPKASVRVACDVSDFDAVNSALSEVAYQLGGVDSVVANAAAFGTLALAQDMPLESWREVIDTNLTGSFYLARAAHRFLRESRGGRMVLISSGSAQIPIRGSSAYGPSKAGVECLAKALCADWAKDGICVNAVAPGAIGEHRADIHSTRARDKIMSRVPLGRYGETSELANVVLFLSGDLSSYVTGQVIGVDGGWGLR